jgi:hypothetical protein
MPGLYHNLSMETAGFAIILVISYGSPVLTYLRIGLIPVFHFLSFLSFFSFLSLLLTSRYIMKYRTAAIL